MKGGENGVDIFPGDSARSPLIHYVARVVPDMEMPPPGKGDPLTAEQVGILRRWIDQGAEWGATNAEPHFNFSATPTLRFIHVNGDKQKFREIEGVREGWGGGAADFSFRQQLGSDTSLLLQGHALAPDTDVSVMMELRKRDLGFVRGGFEQWRRYYDDTGGYYGLYAMPAFSLGRDLHLDIGRAWVDLGLTLPDLPQIVVGYEYQFKDGAKSMLEWGNVAGKRIYPASEEIDEHTHIAKADITYDIAGWRLEDNARVEFYDSKTRHDDSASFSLGPLPDSTVYTKHEDSHTQGMNTFRVERQLTDWWLVSGGYLYSRLDGEASLDQMTLDVFGSPAAGSFYWADGIMLKRESQIGSVGNLWLPTPYLSISAGAQSEWTRQEGLGKVNLDSGDPYLPVNYILYPASVESDLDTRRFSENGTLRFTAIPSTVLFAETRLAQETIGQFEQDVPALGTTPDPTTTFLRNTDYSNDQVEWRAGFNTSPWTWAALSGHYKWRSSDSDYDNTRFALQPAGYPAFIRARTIDTHEFEGKLVLKPLSWLKTTFTFQSIRTDYSTTTGPVPSGTTPEGLQAADYDAHVYGAHLILTPWARLYFSGSFTYTDNRLEIASNGDPSIVPYRGNIYSLIVNANYALNQATDLSATYIFSQARYGQANLLDGLPLGLDYTRHGVTIGVTRRWSTNVTTQLRYGYFQYSEPSTGGLNDYNAHGVMALLTVRWP